MNKYLDEELSTDSEILSKYYNIDEYYPFERREVLERSNTSSLSRYAIDQAYVIYAIDVIVKKVILREVDVDRVVEVAKLADEYSCLHTHQNVLSSFIIKRSHPIDDDTDIVGTYHTGPILVEYIVMEDYTYNGCEAMKHLTMDQNQYIITKMIEITKAIINGDYFLDIVPSSFKIKVIGDDISVKLSVLDSKWCRSEKERVFKNSMDLDENRIKRLTYLIQLCQLFLVLKEDCMKTVDYDMLLRVFERDPVFSYRNKYMDLVYYTILHENISFLSITHGMELGDLCVVMNDERVYKHPERDIFKKSITNGLEEINPHDVTYTDRMAYVFSPKTIVITLLDHPALIDTFREAMDDKPKLMYDDTDTYFNMYTGNNKSYQHYPREYASNYDLLEEMLASITNEYEMGDETMYGKILTVETFKGLKKHIFAKVADKVVVYIINTNESNYIPYIKYCHTVLMIPSVLALTFYLSEIIFKENKIESIRTGEYGEDMCTGEDCSDFPVSRIVSTVVDREIVQLVANNTNSWILSIIEDVGIVILYTYYNEDTEFIDYKPIKFEHMGY